jgi:hypothetical protein
MSERKASLFQIRLRNQSERGAIVTHQAQIKKKSLSSTIHGGIPYIFTSTHKPLSVAGMAIEEIEDACVEMLGRGARSKASGAKCHERLLVANDFGVRSVSLPVHETHSVAGLI